MLKTSQIYRSLRALSFLLRFKLPINPKTSLYLTPKAFFSESNLDLDAFDPLEEAETAQNLSKFDKLKECKTIDALLDYHEQRKKERKPNDRFMILRMFGRLAKNPGVTWEQLGSRYSRFIKEEILMSIDSWDHLSIFFFF